jgi:hypothetical protein
VQVSFNTVGYEADGLPDFCANGQPEFCLVH